jgi:hypothetical protein
MSPLLRAALEQAVACHYPCICGTVTKAQGCVEALVCVELALLRSR